MKREKHIPHLYIDLMILTPGLGGGLTFVKELVSAVIKNLDAKFRIVVIGDKEVIKTVLGPLHNTKIIDTGHRKLRIFRIFSSILIYRKIGKSETDIIWGPLNSLGYFGTPKARKIVTIHDTMPLDHPEFYGTFQRIFRQYQLRRSIVKANFVVSVSQFTKSRILHHFPTLIGLDNVQVVHEGIELPRDQGVDTVATKTKKRFCLFVGVGRKNKNLEFLVDVHNILRQKYDYRGSLVIVGALTSEFERELTSRALYPDSLDFPGFISTKEKQRLYSECDAFVFPTLYEGFGLPPLEAAIHGAPVVVSDIEVMREVCSDFGNFGCLKDPAAFASTLAEVIRNPDKRVMDPKLLTSKFDWQKAVSEYSAQIESISYRTNRLCANLQE